jgi:hypothetical protein
MAQGGAWPLPLLELAEYGSPDAELKPGIDLRVQEGFWGRQEKSLDPPVALLSWLIRNLRRTLPDREEGGRRVDLLRGDHRAILNALRTLREDYSARAWFIFEGPTCPDAYVVTKDVLIVVEGKRTEPGPTTSTKWMPGRHQIWRHIDAAWEICGDRQVYGLFIVDSPGLEVPEIWCAAAHNTLSRAALEGSFPHRSATETAAISRCFLGVTTWRRVCARFGLSYEALPDSLATGATQIESGPQELV